MDGDEANQRSQVRVQSYKIHMATAQRMKTYRSVLIYWNFPICIQATVHTQFVYVSCFFPSFVALRIEFMNTLLL